MWDFYSGLPNFATFLLNNLFWECFEFEILRMKVIFLIWSHHAQTDLNKKSSSKKNILKTIQ